MTDDARVTPRSPRPEEAPLIDAVCWHAKVHRIPVLSWLAWRWVEKLAVSAPKD